MSQKRLMHLSEVSHARKPAVLLACLLPLVLRAWLHGVAIREPVACVFLMRRATLDRRAIHMLASTLAVYVHIEPFSF